MKDECQLFHVRCGACGKAIHEDGKCGCEDNRHHPIADLQKDRITRLEAALYKQLEILAWVTEYYPQQKYPELHRRGAESSQAIMQAFYWSQEDFDSWVRDYIEQTALLAAARRARLHSSREADCDYSPYPY